MSGTSWDILASGRGGLNEAQQGAVGAAPEPGERAGPGRGPGRGSERARARARARRAAEDRVQDNCRAVQVDMRNPGLPARSVFVNANGVAPKDVCRL